MSLSYVASFVAKTESQSNPIPRSFVVRSLSQFVGDLPEDRLLCPVRAMKFYLEATRGLTPRSNNLFVSPKRRSRPISKNAVAFFLKETISGAGALSPLEGQGLRAHSIRGISTTVAFYKNWSVRSILRAAAWKSNSVFSSFYLKDITYVWENLRSLGPFVSAGQVINTPRD